MDGRIAPASSVQRSGLASIAANCASGEGHARRRVGLAGTRLRALGPPRRELQTRVELTENHRLFAGIGFRAVGNRRPSGP